MSNTNDSNGSIEWKITPGGFLAEVGWTYRHRGRWLDLKLCPVCGGHQDRSTFAVHAEDGNYTCLRSSCGATGSFWMLIELAGRNPRDFIAGRERPSNDSKPKKKKKFVYGR
jgi:hypothetical protein